MARWGPTQDPTHDLGEFQVVILEDFGGFWGFGIGDLQFGIYWGYLGVLAWV